MLMLAAKRRFPLISASIIAVRPAFRSAPGRGVGVLEASPHPFVRRGGGNGALHPEPHD